MSDVTARQAALSFEEYVEQRSGALWPTAWLLTGDVQLAEDLVQTALFKAWPKWSRVGAEGFDAYVRRVLFTTYTAWWRRRWNGEHPTEDVPDSGSPDPADGVALQRDLMTALTALPRGQRAVVVLRWFEDLTEAQTADVLGCSIGTVKSQASRALATLRTTLTVVEGDER